MVWKDALGGCLHPEHRSGLNSASARTAHFFFGGSKQVVMNLLRKVNLCQMGSGTSVLTGSSSMGKQPSHRPVTWGQDPVSK